MKVVRKLANCASGDSPTSDAGHVVSIGVYDGVHLGHRSVIELARSKAIQQGLQTAVVTFEPHPAYVLRADNAPKLLTTLEHKLELLEAAGVDTTVVVPFDLERAAETPEDFVTSVLVECLGARVVVVGDDFHFGARRSGNVAVLAELGSEHGFAVEGLKLLSRADGLTEPVSSTATRRALAGGNVATAAGLLGRNHEVWGTVVHGDERGRQIGFPTANIAVDVSLAVPADAVYAGWYVRPDGARWPAAVNVGKRPTFYQNANHSVVEAHLIGFGGQLYHERARVEFVRLLRSEQRFEGIEALVAQLQIDIAQASQLLAS